MELKKKSIESIRIFTLLLYKCWLVRKRQWISSLMGEILIPVSIIFGTWMVSYYYSATPPYLEVKNKTHCNSQSLEQLIDLMSEKPVEIIYAPSDPFTDKLMTTVVDCLKYNANISGFDSESTVMSYSKDKNDWSPLLAVIFEESTTKHLHYKLRSKTMLFQYSPLVYALYNDRFAGEMIYYYTETYFVQTQVCLDQSYIRIMSNKTAIDIPQTLIQQIPYPAETVHALFFLHENLLVLTAVFTIPVLIETSKTTKEKFVGINFLMSVNGIPNTLNFLSWIVSGLLLSSILCITIVLLMIYSPEGHTICALYYGNPFILFMIFIFHLGHSITFAIFVSAHFSKSFYSALTVIMTNFLVLTVGYFLLIYVNVYFLPYVGIIFPGILLCQAMDEVFFYETLGIGVQWNNLFVNSNPVNNISGSIGMVIVLSVIGTFFYFWLAIYMNAIKPGKYGIGKHPLFFLMRNDKKKDINNTENLIFDGKDKKYFEHSPTTNYTPGIQIRNLKKIYDISFFSKEKVHALQGVSIDFYKGQITSLLGHNGAGKSTLMSILTGAVSPTDGSILINSKNLKDHACEILKDVGFYAKEDMYFSNLTVKEQLKLFAMLKENKSKSEIESNITTLIQKLKLIKVKNCLPDELSEDEKRKLCLGMALVNDPSTLILDEPTSRLDQENKRVIWDILMEMRDQKTIVICTHDMEEADILGDRIAILHEGRIKSYGTSLYLKKMIANQSHVAVTLFIERWSDPEQIRNEFHDEASIVERQDKKIIVNVLITSTLADSLKKLKEKKKDLGLTDFKLSHVGLEQVFLKVAEDCDSSPKPNTFMTRDQMKLVGIALYIQQFRALFIKKLAYFWKNPKTLFVQAIAVSIALFSMFTILKSSSWIYKTEPEVVNIRPDTCKDPYTVYASSDKMIGNEYNRVSEYFSARSLKISDTSLDNGLIRRAQDDLVDYCNYLIAAAEFNKTVNGSLIANAFYSETIKFSLPISINLLSNTIIRNLLGSDYSISISAQALIDIFELEDVVWLLSIFINSAAVVIFVIPIYFAIAMFVVNPSRESARGLKHLQMMTGVSGFTYWTSMFLADLAHFAILAVLIVIGLMGIDYSLGLYLYRATEIAILILLLMLFAINVLPLVYCFSFIKMKKSFALTLLTLIPIGIGLTTVFQKNIVTYFQPSSNFLLFLSTVVGDFVMFCWSFRLDNSNKEKYFLARVAYLSLPYVSFLRGLTNLQTTGLLNGVCRRVSEDSYQSRGKYFEVMCCELNNGDRKCQKLIPYFRDDGVDSLKVSVIYLCAMPIFYFGILALLESRLVQKIIHKCTKYGMKNPIVDEQLQVEKSIILQKIQALKKNHSSLNIEEPKNDIATKEFLLVYELRKHNGKVNAVEDFSLRVDGHECFGLFGANGSGKSTILNMIVGEEIPDHGVMLLGGKDFKNNEKKFLSQIGYCSQYDATLKGLNSYDHLRLFALLRGVPEDQVDNEVRTWIDRFDLKNFASQQCVTLSSGNSQRLNVAMAMVGNPNLILLDEPTTRIDPRARRLFWTTVKSCQAAGQTFLLALHNSEHSEALCERTAAMLDGKLICIGTPEEMKQRFGAGYDVQIRLNSVKVKNQLDRIKKDMCLLLHCILTNENSSCLMYHVTGVCMTWSKIYEVMNQIKRKYDCVDDFLVVVRLAT